jgi:hypothetical protein
MVSSAPIQMKIIQYRPCGKHTRRSGFGQACKSNARPGMQVFGNRIHRGSGQK